MQPPIPKPFVMEPWTRIPSGQILFTFFAPIPLQEFVGKLACVLHVQRHIGGEQCYIHINPRYDPEEAYKFIRFQLESECQRVTLDPVWGLEEEEDE